jgi:hypothetical protein
MEEIAQFVFIGAAGRDESPPAFCRIPRSN